MSYFKNLFNAIFAQAGQSFDLSKMSGAEIEDFIRVSGGNQSISGQSITPDSAMTVAAAWRCIHLIAGSVAVMPRDLITTTGEDHRQPAVGHSLRKLIRTRPNERQTPKQFFEMQTAWLMLRGNAYALKVTGVRKEVISLIPLAPPQVEVKELPNGKIVYIYTNGKGDKITYPREKILHVSNLSLDGTRGLSTLTYMRESLALSIDGEVAASTLMKNGTFVDGVITVPEVMSSEAHKRLTESWDAHRTGVDNAGKTPILEQGAELKKLSMSAADLQFLEQRSWQKHDIAMFFGVPPHMLGMTEKATSWGSGIEQMNIGFVNYTLNNYLVAWEEALNRDCLSASDQEDTSVKFNVNGLLKGDSKTRWDAYTKGRQWGIYSANDVRKLEDMNPRTDPEGDDFAVPPNQTKDEDELGDKPKEENDEE